jgi:hypothetical protein
MKLSLLFLMPVFLFAAGGCAKDPLLTPPSTNVLAITTLTQVEGLLNNAGLLALTPVMGEQSADSYLLADPPYPNLLPMDLNLYSWRPDIYAGAISVNDWNGPYEQVSVCNNALQALLHIDRTLTNHDRWDAARGKALFLRSHAFIQLLNLFSPAYTPANAGQATGIPLPLNTDLHTSYARSSLRDCYQQITDDLQTAAALLPVRGVDTSYPKPDKAAACALLARAYHLMARYPDAKQWADSALTYAPPLVDYNSIGPRDKPYARLAPEVLYNSTLMISNVLQVGIALCTIDPVLYQSYDSNDLRKTLFFKPTAMGQAMYRNCYASGFLPFSGVATDEVYLIRAECHAQAGNIGPCLADMNTLLRNRYRGFIPYTTMSREDALQLVWREEQKELLFRGQRWPQLKRLNAAGANIVLRRSLYGQSYQLAPGDKKYVLPVPAGGLAGNAIVQFLRE